MSSDPYSEIAKNPDAYLAEMAALRARWAQARHPWEVRYRRFKDLPDGEWQVMSRGSFADCLEDFLDLKAHHNIGDMAAQDCDKGYAEIALWFGGYQ